MSLPFGSVARLSIAAAGAASLALIFRKISSIGRRAVDLDEAPEWLLRDLGMKDGRPTRQGMRGSARA